MAHFILWPVFSALRIATVKYCNSVPCSITVNYVPQKLLANQRYLPKMAGLLRKFCSMRKHTICVIVTCNSLSLMHFFTKKHLQAWKIIFDYYTWIFFTYRINNVRLKVKHMSVYSYFEVFWYNIVKLNATAYVKDLFVWVNMRILAFLNNLLTHSLNNKYYSVSISSMFGIQSSQKLCLLRVCLARRNPINGFYCSCNIKWLYVSCIILYNSLTLLSSENIIIHYKYYRQNFWRQT